MLMDRSLQSSRHHLADLHMEERSLWREGRYYPVVCGRLKAARTELPSGKRWLKIELEITRGVLELRAYFSTPPSPNPPPHIYEHYQRHNRPRHCNCVFHLFTSFTYFYYLNHQFPTDLLSSSSKSHNLAETKRLMEPQLPQLNIRRNTTSFNKFQNLGQTSIWLGLVGHATI